MLNKILTTPVDELVEIIKNSKKTTTIQLSTKLRLPIEIIEKWLAVLEEFKVIKIQYSGLEAYITYVVPKGEKEKNEEGPINIQELKSSFVKKCTIRGFDHNEMVKAWPRFVLRYEEEIKTVFLRTTEKRGYSQPQIDRAWTKYREELTQLENDN